MLALASSSREDRREIGALGPTTVQSSQLNILIEEYMHKAGSDITES